MGASRNWWGMCLGRRGDQTLAVTSSCLMDPSYVLYLITRSYYGTGTISLLCLRTFAIYSYVTALVTT
ncbi:hypothetical protein K474DRAFT_1192250 [Panus rudis PR-1116 ss-1]|nr:hypothetical protein K474DRAFT_1192250 [Panus rudis PR-1116 ss-1]